eukprot:s467_g31.t1
MVHAIRCDIQQTWPDLHSSTVFKSDRSFRREKLQLAGAGTFFRKEREEGLEVEEEANLASENLMVDIGFQEIAALKHSLKVALRVYDALQNARCFACQRMITAEDRMNIGMRYYRYALCAPCFHALTTLVTDRDTTLAEDHCVALTDDGVYAAAFLLSVYTAGSELRLPQADATWVRNIIANPDNFGSEPLRHTP